MDTVAIPEEAARQRPWARLKLIGPPIGVRDDDCGTVHALVEHLPDAGLFPDRIHVPFRPSKAELDALMAGEPLWVSTCGRVLQPFSVSVGRTV